MKNLNLTCEEFFEKRPAEEVSLEDLDVPKKYQITFKYPEVLREYGDGDTIDFSNDGVNTYFETSGAYQNAGMFKFSNKIYTDMELYEYVYNHFRVLIEDYTLVELNK